MPPHQEFSWYVHGLQQRTNERGRGGEREREIGEEEERREEEKRRRINGGIARKHPLGQVANFAEAFYDHHASALLEKQCTRPFELLLTDPPLPSIFHIFLETILVSTTMRHRISRSDFLKAAVYRGERERCVVDTM